MWGGERGLFEVEVPYRGTTVIIVRSLFLSLCDKATVGARFLRTSSVGYSFFFCFFVLVTKTKNSGLYHISGPSDARYIRVETCMFMVKLPQYSTQEIMTEKLLYAINCREDPLTDIT